LSTNVNTAGIAIAVGHSLAVGLAFLENGVVFLIVFMYTYFTWKWLGRLRFLDFATHICS